MRLFSTLLLIFSVVSIFAQEPANDDCDGLIDLGLAPTCPDSTFFNNVDATTSEVFTDPALNIPNCWDNVNRDVWFAFTTNTFTDYTIYLEGVSDDMGNESIQNPQMALYRGDCVQDGLAELLCVEADDGETSLSFDAIGLTPNTQYFLRVDDFSSSAAPNSGAFYLCVDSVQVVNTIPGESNACSGELYDSGGPDEDYSNNEDGIFTICPNTVTNCITFSLEYYNIEAGSNDQIIIYEGDNTNPGNIIGQIGGNNFSTDFGGGGVCYEVQASSECLTVQFISDGTTTFEGFAGAWECSAIPCEEPEVITVDDNITNEQIIDFISTPQTTVDITNIDCEDGFYGTFEADNTSLGLERGLLLTTGSVDLAPGPNNTPSASFIGLFDGNNYLDSLSINSGSTLVSNDACVIDLEVFSATNELTFEYVFGSEEYPEFVGDGFNDIFAFLISGPGIVGETYLDGQQNIAVLPTDQTPVEIDNVNNNNNWQFYRDNTNSPSIQYDGLTSDFFGVKKSLTARAEVIPCSTYQLKLAIADRGDWSYDSGVFISELRGGTPELSVTFNNGIDYLIEDCTNTPDEIFVQLNSAQEDTVTYNVVITGTATQDVDYTLDIPNSVTFLPGETGFSFDIQPLSDMLVEGIETIEISLTNNFGCGDVVYTTLVIELHDELNISINAGLDTAFVCQDSSVTLLVEGAATYFWAPPAIFDDPSSPEATAFPQNSLWVEVEGNVGVCQDVDSIFLQLIDPMISIETEDPTTFCRGETVTLEAVNNVGNSNLVWTPADGIEDVNAPIVEANPQNSIQYIAEVEITGCVARDTIDITVDIFDFPEIAADTLICQNYSVQLGFLPPLDSVSTSYQWSPEDGLDDPTSAEPIATPETTTTYQLIATSFSEVCADTAEVTVEVFPADVEIQNPDTVFLCKGESVDLEAVTSTGSAENLIWGPYEENLSDSLGLVVNAQPDATVQYFSTFVVGECIVRDSVFVKVDSLPQGLELIPADTTVCVGTLVPIVSSGYDPTLYPDILFDWEPNLGFETADSTLTIVINALETTEYKRYAISGACIDSSTMMMNVDLVPNINIMPSDTSICVGESIDIVAEIDLDPDELSWSPSQNLSCTNCLTPTASPTSSTTYALTVINGTCSAEASTNIQIIQPPSINLIGDTEICPGESIQLNNISQNGVTYIWSSPDDPDFSSNDPDLIVEPTTTTNYVLEAVNQCGDVQGNVTISVLEPLTLEVPDDQLICSDSEVSFSASTAAPAGITETYTWTDSDGNTIGEGSEITVNDLNASTTITVTYENKCETLTESFEITVALAPTVLFPTDTIICFNGSVVLNDAPNDNLSYVWSSPDDPDFSSTDSAPEVSPDMTTTYEVIASVDGCPDFTGELTILVVEQASLSINADTTICNGDEIILTAITTTPDEIPQAFEWLANGETISTEQSVAVSPDMDTEYTLVYNYGLDCEILTQSMTVFVEESINITELLVGPDDGSDPVNLPIGTIDTITAIVTPDNLDLTFSWTVDGDPYGDNTNSITHTSAVEGLVNYAITVTSGIGCTDEASVEVLFVEPTIAVPNVFTPNGDNKNEFFFPVTSGTLEVIDLKVYNRWGQLVFDNDDLENGWDGTYNGNPAPSEVYIYKVQYRKVNDPDAPIIEEKGDVTLLR